MSSLAIASFKSAGRFEGAWGVGLDLLIIYIIYTNYCTCYFENHNPVLFVFLLD